MITVKVKGTTLRFPDSFSKEQIDAIVKRDFFGGDAAPSASPEAEAFRANQKRIHDEKIAAGGMEGADAPLDPTLYERAVTYPINVAGGIAKNVAGLAAGAGRAALDTVTLGPERRIVKRALGGDTSVTGYLSDLPVVNPVLRGAADVAPTIDKGVDMAEGAVGVRPNVNMEFERAFADTAGGMVDIPLVRWVKALRGAKAGVEAGADVLEALAKRGVTLTDEQVKIARSGGKLKLTAEQMKQATAAAPEAAAPVSKVVPEAPVGAPAAPVANAPAAPVPAPLSKKAQALQAKIAMIEQKIAEAEAKGLPKGKIGHLKSQRTTATRDLNAEIKASAKFAKNQAKQAQRPIPALAGSADAETAPEILFSEQVPRARGLFRTEAQKIAIAQGAIDPATGKPIAIISDADIARAAAEGSKVALRDKAGEMLRGVEAPAPTAMGETGPVGKVAQSLLYDTNSVHAMRMQAVDDWITRTFKGWTQEQYDIVIDTLEGKITAEQMAKATPEIQRVTEQVRRLFTGVDREATMLKVLKELRSGEKVPYYGRRNFFPHLDTIDIGEVETMMKKGHVPLRPDQKSRLLKGGDVDDVLDPAQAAILRKNPLPAQRVKAGTKSGSITYERDSDGAFNRDLPTVIRRYLDRTYRQFEEVKHFGPEPQKGISEIAEKASANGENGEFVRHTLELALGGGVRATDSNLTGVIGDLISFEALAKLPFASIGQINQVVNPMVKAGFGKTATAALRLANDLIGTGDGELLAAARRAAPIFGDIMHGITGERPGSWVARFGKMQLKATGFRAEDEALRYLSAATGVLHAEDTLKAARGIPPSWLARATGDLRKTTTIRDQALRDLMDARVDVEGALKTGRLTEMDKARYAHWFARKTQFGMRVEDAPLYFAKGPVGKLFWLFKKWGVNQMDLARREVLGPVAKGDVRPLTRFLIATPIVGEGANQVMDVVMNRDRSESGIPKRVFDAYMAGSFGFAGQILNSVTRETGMDAADLFPTARTVAETARLFAGPAFSALREGTTEPLTDAFEDVTDTENLRTGEGRIWRAGAGVSRHAKMIRNWIRDDGEELTIQKKLKGQL